MIDICLYSITKSNNLIYKILVNTIICILTSIDINYIVDVYLDLLTYLSILSILTHIVYNYMLIYYIML